VVAGAAIGVRGKLDPDFVGLVDDVVVGNDVAARVDNEAGAQCLANAGALVVVAPTATLAAEEAVEEVLHVALVASVSAVIAIGRLRRNRAALQAAASARGGGLLGHRFRIDIHDGRADLFGNLREAVGQCHRVRDGEGASVAGVDVLLLFTADVAGDDRAGKNADGKRRKHCKSSGETPVAELVPQSASGKRIR